MAKFSKCKTIDAIARNLVKGNVIVVSHLANAIKQNATPFQIRLVADFYEAVIQKAAISELKEMT